MFPVTRLALLATGDFEVRSRVEDPEWTSALHLLTSTCGYGMLIQPSPLQQATGTPSQSQHNEPTERAIQ